MNFHFDLPGDRQVEYRLGEPFLDEAVPRWGCKVDWTGCETGSVVIQGASSLQSVALALEFIRQEVDAVAKGPVFQQGQPVVL